jgi:hypothetical protein
MLCKVKVPTELLNQYEHHEEFLMLNMAVR